MGPGNRAATDGKENTLSVGALLVGIITLYEGLIISRAILSWFAAPNSTHPAVQWLTKLTEPVLEPIRTLLPVSAGIDLSPLLVLIGLELVKRILI